MVRLDSESIDESFNRLSNSILSKNSKLSDGGGFPNQSDSIDGEEAKEQENSADLSDSFANVF